MKRTLLLTAISTVLIIACSTASNLVESPLIPYNVEKYGENAPKIWTPLNQKEMETLIKAKENFDDEAKILLSIFLTGDLKQQEAIEAALNVYRKFIQLCDKELASISDAKEKGKKLHELFFKQFIGKPRKKGAPSTGIPGILLIKEYDTNSANLLFAIIAEKYGFSAEIAVVEGDVAEIKGKSIGQSISVIYGKSYLTLKHKEMFSAVNIFPFLENGYDFYINMGVFDDLHKSKPDLFDNPTVELQKYYKKSPSTLNEVILLQYKKDKAAEIIESESALVLKRIEMAAHLTDLCEVLLDRLWAWRNYHFFILERNIPGELLSFIETINEELHRTDEHCSNLSGFEEGAWDFYLFSAFEYANAVKGAKMKPNIVKGYKYLPPITDNYENKKNLLSRALYHYVKLVIERKMIESELTNVANIIEIIPVEQTRIDVAATFYHDGGEFYLQMKNYWEAGKFFAECAFAGESRFKRICVNKGVAALYQYASISLDKGVCATAADARDKCLEKISDKKACAQIVEKYNKTCGR